MILAVFKKMTAPKKRDYLYIIVYSKLLCGDIISHNLQNVNKMRGIFYISLFKKYPFLKSFFIRERPPTARAFLFMLHI